MRLRKQLAAEIETAESTLWVAKEAEVSLNRTRDRIARMGDALDIALENERVASAAHAAAQRQCEAMRAALALELKDCAHDSATFAAVVQYEAERLHRLGFNHVAPELLHPQGMVDEIKAREGLSEREGEAI